MPPATPDAVTDRLSQHLRNGPPQCQVQFPIGAGRVPVAGEQPRTVIQIDVVVPSASEDRSVSVRILAVPGAYLLVAQAVTPQRCTFDCLTIHLPECAR